MYSTLLRRIIPLLAFTTLFSAAAAAAAAAEAEMEMDEGDAEPSPPSSFLSTTGLVVSIGEMGERS